MISACRIWSNFCEKCYFPIIGLYNRHAVVQVHENQKKGFQLSNRHEYNSFAVQITVKENAKDTNWSLRNMVQ